MPGFTLISPISRQETRVLASFKASRAGGWEH